MCHDAAMRRSVGLVIAPMLAACALLAPPGVAVPIEELDLEPREIRGAIAERPIGPHMVVLEGEVAGDTLMLVAQADGDGMCLASWRGAEGSQGCGPLPDPARQGHFGITLVGGLDPSPGLPREIVGVVSPAVAAVVVQLRDEAPVEARLVPLAPAQIDAQAFIVYVPFDVIPASVTAVDAEGAELGVLSVLSPEGR